MQDPEVYLLNDLRDELLHTERRQDTSMSLVQLIHGESDDRMREQDDDSFLAQKPSRFGASIDDYFAGDHSHVADLQIEQLSDESIKL